MNPKGTPYGPLTEQDVGLLESLANNVRNRGNCSSSGVAACSTHAIRRLAPAMLRVGRGCLAQIEEPAALADVSKERYARMFGAACDALVQISDRLGINSRAEPIIAAIDRLRAQAQQTGPA